MVKENIDNKKTKIKPLISISNIVKSYGKTEVLKGISFDVNPGERVSIVGANGAGKTTLSEIIAKVKDPTSGKITYNLHKKIDKKTKKITYEEAKSKSEISSKIGIQFQDSSYPDFYKVSDLVNFVINAAGIKITNKRLEELYETFDLKNLKNDIAKGLSGGQQQRLNILMAIVNDPLLLILDEVGTGLDVESRTKIKSYIQSYADHNDATILLVSHNSDEVVELTERVIVIHNGKIYSDQPLEDILKEWKQFDLYMNNLYLNVFKKNLDLRANKTGRQFTLKKGNKKEKGKNK